MKSKTIMYGVMLFLFFLTGSWALPGSALADYRQYYGWGPGMMGWGGTMGWFGPLGMILFWVVIILVIVLLIRGIRTSKGTGQESGPAPESALEILKKRYARGEINKEEYLERKKDLE
jgi:putative membrane protein